MRKHRNRSDRNRYYRYGLTWERFDELGENQGGKCLICNEDTELVVDHNHANKKVRALLCRECNTGLGKFKDNAKLIRRAAAYLDAFNSTHPNPQELLLGLRRIGGF